MAFESSALRMYQLYHELENVADADGVRFFAEQLTKTFTADPQALCWWRRLLSDRVLFLIADGHPDAQQLAREVRKIWLGNPCSPK